MLYYNVIMLYICYVYVMYMIDKLLINIQYISILVYTVIDINININISIVYVYV